jgi:hypothetical protein
MIAIARLRYGTYVALFWGFPMKHRLMLHSLALAVCLVNATGRCKSDDTLRQRFLREAPRGWQELQRLYERIVGTGTVDAVTRVDGKTVAHLVWDFKVKQNGPWIFFERTDAKNGTGLAGASNSSYVFSVSKLPDKSWTLQGVEKESTDVYWEARRGGGFGFFQSPWIMIGRFPLNELTSDPSFKIRALTEEIRDGQSLVMLEFDAAVKNAQPGWAPSELRSGRLVLDPSIFWAMREFSVTLEPGPRKFRWLIEYDAPAKKIKRVEGVDEGLRDTTKATFEVKQLEFRAAPETDFTMSVYGFVEPKTPEKPTRWWLWGALTGGGLLVLAAVFDWLRRRAKR